MVRLLKGLIIAVVVANLVFYSLPSAWRAKADIGAEALRLAMRKLTGAGPDCPWTSV